MTFADGEWWPTSLEDIYPAGTPAEEVTPYDMRGLPLKRWMVLMVSREAERIRALAPQIDPAETEIMRKRIWHPRDDYGWRSSAR
jgi:hypothetical protein